MYNPEIGDFAIGVMGIVLLLGIWKFVEIVVWVFSHLSITVV